MQNMYHLFIERICWLHTTIGKKLLALTKLVFVIEALNVSCEFDITGFMDLRKLQTTNTHQITQYRVIRNECRGFNNLSYTIHLR